MKRVIRILGFSIAFLIIGLTTVSSQEVVMSEATSAVANGLTGFSSDISGGWAIVSSPQKDNNGKKSVGGVTFYQLTEGQWKIFQEVLPSDASELSNFGTSVVIEGTIAVITAIGDHESGLFSGAAYVYEYDYLQASWIQTAKLKASDSTLGKRFGGSVDIINNTIAIGAHNADGNQPKSGAVYIYEKVDNAWQQSQKIFSATGLSNDYFGHALHFLDETHLAVGAYNADGAAERSGVVFIFQKEENTWLEGTKLFDPNGDSSDLYGYSITSGPMSNEDENTTRFPGILFIGAPATNHDNSQTGSVYFYIENENGWSLGMELTESESEHNDHFGVSISANSKGTLFVGANRANTDSSLNSGGVYKYETLLGRGIAVSQSVKVSASVSNAYDHFGTRIAVDEENVIISSPYSDINGKSNSGSVTFFRIGDFVSSNSSVDEVYSINQNTPNPSENSTVISYRIRKAGEVNISVYNLNGQLVKVLVDEFQDFGFYNVNFDTRGFESGVYIYKIEVNDFKKDIKMIIGK